MAGAFHGSGGADEVVNVGVSGPGVVVRAVLADLPKDADITSVAEAIKATAFKITRAGELMAREASKRLGVQQGILDLSLAPTPAEGRLGGPDPPRPSAWASAADRAPRQLSPC